MTTTHKSNIKKLIAIILSIVLICILAGCEKVDKSKSLVNAQTVITKNDNYVLLNINEKVKLSDLKINMDGEEESGDAFKWKPENDKLEISDGAIKAKTYGLFNIVITKGEMSYDIFAVSKNKADNEYVVFESNFNKKKNEDLSDENQLPDYLSAKGTVYDGNSASIKDNELLIENRRESGMATTVSILSKVRKLSNYQVSVDFVLNGYSNDAQAIVGVKNDMVADNSYRFSVTENPVSPFGAKMSTVKNGVVEPFSRSGEYMEHIDNKLTNVKVSCIGSKYSLRINNRFIFENDDTTLGNGGVYIGCDNGAMRVRNLKITIPPERVDKSTENVVNLCRPHSNVKSLPAIYMRINSNEDLFNVCKENRPGGAIIKVNDKLEVLGAENSVIDGLENIISYFENRLVPVFKVDDGQSAKALATYLKTKYTSNDICGCVMSSDAALIKLVREQCTNVTGILDCSSSDLKNSELHEKYEQLSSNLCTSILVNENSMTKENIDYFQKRLCSVVGECTIKDIDFATTILKNGISGIVTTDYQKLWDVCKRLPENAVGTVPYTIGLDYNTNDIIRIGVLTTTDNRLLGIKGKIDSNLITSLENKTLADAIASQEKNKDDSSFTKVDLEAYIKYLDKETKDKTVFAFELSGNKTGSVLSLKNLLLSVELTGNSLIIANSSERFIEAKSQFPTVSRCANYSNQEGRQVLDFNKVATPLLLQNCSSAIITLADEQVPILLKHYGLMSIKENALDVSSGGHASYGNSNFVEDIEPWEKYEIKIGEKSDFHASALLKSGELKDVKVTPVSLDDNFPGMTVDEEGNASAVKAGTTKAVLIYNYDSKSPSGRYAMFSKVVTINIVE